MFRRALLILAATPALVLAADATPPRGNSYLVSVTGISLARDEYVDGFAIDTWGVDVLAVCHIPPGWEMRAGREATPVGIIAGEASHGVTFLNRPRLGELEGLVLVRLSGSLDRRNERQAFSGRAQVGRYGVEPGGREVPLAAANLILSPARTCPAPQ